MEDDWKEISDYIETVCSHIFDSSNKLLKKVTESNFDINALTQMPKSNANDMATQVKRLNSIFTSFICIFEREDKLESVLQILDAKQQVLQLAMLIDAMIERQLNECIRLRFILNSTLWG